MAFLVGAEHMQRAGGVLVQENLSLSDQAVYRRYPGYITPGDLRLDRAASARIDALAKGDYFSPWNSVTRSPGTVVASSR